jgi:hypothetical protein
VEAKLSIDDRAAFDRSVRILADLKKDNRQFLALNFAVEIAVLIHRSRPGFDDPAGPPPLVADPGSGPPISTGDLQKLVCDETYAKQDDFCPRGAEGPIYKPFTASFKSRKRNNWRNSIDVQRGLACDAPFSPGFLQADHYLEELRFDCPFRNPESAACESPAGLTGSSRTCFNPAKRSGRAAGADNSARPAPKLLTRTETPTVGYWYIEPTVSTLIDLVGWTDRRVPLFPFLMAIYGGSPYFEPWGTEVSRSRFEGDVRLGNQRLAALFDLDPDAPANAKALGGRRRGRRTPRSTPRGDPAPESGSSALSSPVPYRRRSPKTLSERSERQADPAKRMRLLEKSRRGHQRALDALVDHLKERGASKLEEQLDGFDLLAVSGGEGLMFEVKTWTTANLARQVRHGWAQVREYRYRNQEDLPPKVKLYLVLDRKPPSSTWLWDFLAEDCDVIPAWIRQGRLDTLPRFRKQLP